jgi:hypothetical protein
LSKNVANYIKKKLYKINEKELKEILSELTEYLKENKPKYLYNDAFVPESQVLYSGPYWDEQEIMAGGKTFVTGKWLLPVRMCINLSQHLLRCLMLSTRIWSTPGLRKTVQSQVLKHWEENDNGSVTFHLYKTIWFQYSLMSIIHLTLIYTEEDNTKN